MCNSNLSKSIYNAVSKDLQPEKNIISKYLQIGLNFI